jgi:hypothetical protein
MDGEPAGQQPSHGRDAGIQFDERFRGHGAEAQLTVLFFDFPNVRG